MFPGCLLPQGQNEPNTAALTPDTPRLMHSCIPEVQLRLLGWFLLGLCPSPHAHRVRSAVTARGAAQSLHEGTSTTSEHPLRSLSSSLPLASPEAGHRSLPGLIPFQEWFSGSAVSGVG